MKLGFETNPGTDTFGALRSLRYADRPFAPSRRWRSALALPVLGLRESAAVWHSAVLTPAAIGGGSPNQGGEPWHERPCQNGTKDKKQVLGTKAICVIVDMPPFKGGPIFVPNCVSDPQGKSPPWRRPERSAARRSATAKRLAYNFYTHPAKFRKPLRRDALTFEKTKYDVLGRVVSQGRFCLDDESQIVTRTFFDGTSNVYVVDPKGNIKEAVYDDKGHVVKRIDYRGQVRSPEAVYSTIDYRFDRLGQLTNTLDSGNRNIILEYNELGQKVKMVDPDLGTLTYAYNEYGELTNQVDNKSQVTKFHFDNRGRVITKDYTNAPGMEPVDYTYGTNGISLDRLVSVEDSSGSVTYEYGIDGAVTRVNRTIGISTWHTGYDHDNLGRIRELSYPAQDGQTPFVLNYFYNPSSGLLDNIQGGGQTFLAGINYDHFGRRVSMTYGNHVQTDMEYESLTLRLARQAIRQVNGTLLANTEYSFDSVGNVTRKNEKVEGRVNDYTYDDMNRLVRSTFSTPGDPRSTSGYDEHFTYSAEGNILSKDANAPVGATRGNRGYQYKPGTHQVTSYTGEVGTDFSASFSFDYDQNGNRTKKTVLKSDNSMTENWEYSYDAENRLTLVKNFGVVQGTYVYDDSGERVLKTANGTTTLYIEGLSQEVISGGVKYFIFDGLNRIALFQKINSAATAGKTFFLNTDHVGSISVVTGGDGSTLGNVTERLEYKAFGAMFESWGAAEGWTACPSNLSDLGGIGFTGQELDGENNLLYMGARFYDPSSARFLTADTIIDGIFEPEGFNRYSYVKNDPINYSDPSGHESLTGGKTKTVTYVVKKDDCLSVIAENLAKEGLKVTYQEIYQQNKNVQGVTSEHWVREGTTLTITGEETAPSTATATTTPSTASTTTGTSTGTSTTAKKPETTKPKKKDWWDTDEQRAKDEQEFLEFSKRMAEENLRLTDVNNTVPESGSPPTSNPPRIQQPSVDVAAFQASYPNNSPASQASPSYGPSPRIYEDGLRPSYSGQEAINLESALHDYSARTVARDVIRSTAEALARQGRNIFDPQPLIDPETGEEIKVYGGSGPLEFLGPKGALGIGKICGKLINLLKGAKNLSGAMKLSIQFGKGQNQIFHTFRHIDEMGLSRSAVMKAVEAKIASVIKESSDLSTGELLRGVVEVNGKLLSFNACKLESGVINVGRIHKFP